MFRKIRKSENGIQIDDYSIEDFDEFFDGGNKYYIFDFNNKKILFAPHGLFPSFKNLKDIDIYVGFGGFENDKLCVIDNKNHFFRGKNHQKLDILKIAPGTESVFVDLQGNVSNDLSKSKIYLKPQEKPPEGYEAKRGPKGGLYYESRQKDLIAHSDITVRVNTAKIINQTGLHQMLHDSDENVRIEVAKRIDIDGLSTMVYNDSSIKVRNIAANRRKNIRIISSMVNHYKKSNQIKLSRELIKTIKNATSDKEVSAVQTAITEFYKQINFGDLHKEIEFAWENAWEMPQAAQLSDLLQDSIMRQYGGMIRHSAQIAHWSDFTEQMYSKYNRENLDDYVQVHKKITKSILNIFYPTVDNIVVYRGTTKHEISPKDTKATILANPISSWTTKLQIAKSFGDSQNGVVLKLNVTKDDIWSTFLTSTEDVYKREIVVINVIDREAIIVK